jgi:hypothetical protein
VISSQRAGGASWLAPIAAVEYFQAATPLAIDDKIQVGFAQFDLANRRHARRASFLRSSSKPN